MKIRLQTLEDATRKRAVKRLKIIEGQVRGVQGMVEEGRKCVAHAGVRRAGGAPQRGQAVMRNYLENCATHAASKVGLKSTTS